MTENKPGKFLPSLWLKRSDVKDLEECGTGREADVFAILSPQALIITHYDKFISEIEAQAMVRAAIGDTWMRAAEIVDGYNPKLSAVMRDKAQAARGVRSRSRRSA